MSKSLTFALIFQLTAVSVLPSLATAATRGGAVEVDDLGLVQVRFSSIPPLSGHYDVGMVAKDVSELWNLGDANLRFQRAVDAEYRHLAASCHARGFDASSASASMPVRRVVYVNRGVDEIRVRRSDSRFTNGVANGLRVTAACVGNIFAGIGSIFNPGIRLDRNCDHHLVASRIQDQEIRLGARPYAVWHRDGELDRWDGTLFVRNDAASMKAAARHALSEFRCGEAPQAIAQATSHHHLVAKTERRRAPAVPALRSPVVSPAPASAATSSLAGIPAADLKANRVIFRKHGVNIAAHALEVCTSQRHRGASSAKFSFGAEASVARQGLEDLTQAEREVYLRSMREGYHHYLDKQHEAMFLDDDRLACARDLQARFPVRLPKAAKAAAVAPAPLAAAPVVVPEPAEAPVIRNVTPAIPEPAPIAGAPAASSANDVVLPAPPFATSTNPN